MRGQEIGGKFVDPPTFDIAKSYSDSARLLHRAREHWTPQNKWLWVLGLKNLCMMNHDIVSLMQCDVCRFYVMTCDSMSENIIMLIYDDSIGDPM